METLVSDEQVTNAPTIKWVTRTLCGLAIIFGLSYAGLAYLDKPIPSELNTIGSMVIGGLLTMLTKSTPTASTTIEPKKTAGTITVPEQELETQGPQPK